MEVAQEIGISQAQVSRLGEERPIPYAKVYLNVISVLSFAYILYR